MFFNLNSKLEMDSENVGKWSRKVMQKTIALNKGLYSSSKGQLMNTVCFAGVRFIGEVEKNDFLDHEVVFL